MRYRLCGPQASPFPSLRGVQISCVAGLCCQGPTASIPQIQVGRFGLAQAWPLNL